MSTALANTGITDLAVSGGADEKLMSQFATSNAFLPRIELYTAKKQIVMEEKFPANSYALIPGKNQVKDIGKNPVVLPIAFRYKALDFSGPKVLSYFDTKTDDFKRVWAESQKKMPPGVLNKFMAGPEILLITENHGLVTWLLANKSSAKLGADFIKFIKARAFVRLGSALNKGTYVYQYPTVELSTVEFPVDLDPEYIKAEHAKFTGAKVAEQEQTPVDGDAEVLDESNRQR